jgi:hypothetical protein
MKYKKASQTRVGLWSWLFGYGWGVGGDTG